MGRRPSSLDEQIVGRYRRLVETRYSQRAHIWPLITGYNIKIGTAGDWLVCVFTHTGNPSCLSHVGLGELTPDLVDGPTLSRGEIEQTRMRVERFFRVGPWDGVVFVPPDGNIHSELEALIKKHATTMGLAPMRIFLSHKSTDKALVRDFKNILTELGFAPWLDEDAMVAGTALERGLQKGIEESCAAVFFITSNYKDAGYLAAEVDHALGRKRAEGDKFAIIVLVFEELGGSRAGVPAPLLPYVSKAPESHLEGLREILRALPITVGSVRWREA